MKQMIPKWEFKTNERINGKLSLLLFIADCSTRCKLKRSNVLHLTIMQLSVSLPNINYSCPLMGKKCADCSYIHFYMFAVLPVFKFVPCPFIT